jgi:hypothetical protein
MARAKQDRGVFIGKKTSDVRFGSKADICGAKTNVCCEPIVANLFQQAERAPRSVITGKARVALDARPK